MVSYLYQKRIGSTLPSLGSKVSEPHWQTSAECTDKSYLFQIIEPGSLQASGLNGREIKLMNDSNFRVAEKICGRCPVIQQCYQNALPEDLAFTYRAGLLPTAYNDKSRGRPSTDWSAKVCDRGHVGDWVKRDAGSNHYRCRQCKLENDKRYRDRESFRKYGTDTCHRGHVGMYVVPDSGNRYCKGCSNERNAIRKERERAAKMGA